MEIFEKIVLAVGYYAIATYVIGAIGVSLHWWVIRHYLRKERKERPEHDFSEKEMRFLRVSRRLWWTASPFTVPDWLLKLIKKRVLCYLVRLVKRP